MRERCFNKPLFITGRRSKAMMREPEDLHGASFSTRIWTRKQHEDNFLSMPLENFPAAFLLRRF
jgi:hypothetical protein